MPRPWETEEAKKLRDYWREEKFGPDVAPDGTTREEFFDKMVQNGWNREEDQSRIIDLYIIGTKHMSHANYNRDSGKLKIDNPNILKDLMNRKVNNVDDRHEVLTQMKELPVESYHSEGLDSAYRGVEVEMERIQFHKSMREVGWNREGDEKILDALYHCGNRYMDKVTDKKLRDVFYQYGGETADKRSDTLSLISSERRKELSEEDQKVLAEADKQIDEERKKEAAAEALVANPVLRKYMKRMINLGLQDIKPLAVSTPTYAYGPTMKFNDIQLDKATIDGIRQDIEALQINEDLIANKTSEEREEALAQALNDSMKEIVTRRLGDKIKDPERLENLWNLKSNNYNFYGAPENIAELKKKIADQLIDGATNDYQAELQEKDRKENPAPYRRQERLEDGIVKLSFLLKKMQHPTNKEFVEAEANDKDSDKIPVDAPKADIADRDPVMFEKDSEAEQQEMFAIMDELKDLGVENLSELRDDKTLENPFWDNYAAASELSEKQIREMQEKFTKLTDAGLNWDEYIDSGAYANFLKEHKINVGKADDPFEIAKKTCEGRESVEDVKKNCTPATYRQAMKCLDLIEKEYEAKKDKISDLSNPRQLTGWFFGSGYNMMENSLLVTNGFDEKEINGEKVKMIKLGEGIREDRLDRDKLDIQAYNQMVDKAKEAQQLFQENQHVFQTVFENMDRSKNGIAYVLGEGQKEVDSLANDPKLMGKLNRFRHLLYEMKTADQDVCKLMDVKSKKPVMVDPLSADTKFDKDVINKELGILDTCEEMLKDPTTKVYRNSKEYTKIIDSIKALKKEMKEASDPETAKKLYVEKIEKIMNNINKYRVHKAKDGVKKDATTEKLIAAERVEKLLQTRLKNLDEKAYEEKMAATEELFKVNVDPKLSGDEYVLEKAMGKINNMKKVIMETAKEIEEEQKGARRNSIAGPSHINLAELPDDPGMGKKETEKKGAEKKVTEKNGAEKSGERKSLTGNSKLKLEKPELQENTRKSIGGNLKHSEIDGPKK